MNWEKTKSIFLFLLVLLNLLLLLMLWYSDRQYTFGEDKRAAIEQLLSKQNIGIGIEAEIPKRFSPMSSLNVSLEDADAGQLQQVFFDKDAAVRRTIEFEKIILRDGTASLTVGGSDAVYENYNGTAPEGLSGTEVTKYCGEYIKSLKPILGKLTLSSLSTSATTAGSRYTLVYFGEYRGYGLFNSYVVFEMGEYGIERVSISVVEVIEAEQIKKDICSPDEALLTLIHYLREDGNSNDDKLVINQMELGYFFDGAYDAAARVVKAIPCYRINVASEDDGWSKDIYIDAFVNRVKAD